MPHDRLRRINKHFINHITRWLAYLPFGPMAVLYHTGRGSGKQYETTMMVQPMDDCQLIIALTYGQAVDWYRNLQAAGWAKLLWHGKRYRLEKPEPLQAQAALRYYPALEKWFLSKLGTQHFIKLGYRAGNSPGEVSHS